MHADLEREAEGKELDAWKALNVPKPLRAGDVGKTAVDTWWVLTWNTVEGVKTVKARQVAEGHRDPSLRNGIADSSGCVSLRSPYLQAMSLNVL